MRQPRNLLSRETLERLHHPWLAAIEQIPAVGLSAEEGFGEDARALDGRMPFLNILWNVFEVRILGASEGGGLLAPACQAGETIGCVADDGEEVRD